MSEDADGVLTDCRRHIIKHLIGAHLVFHQRIAVSIGLETDTLAKLIHIVNMGHPFIVNNLKKNDALDLADLLCIREFCFLGLIELDRFLFQRMLLFILLHILYLIRELQRL